MLHSVVLFGTVWAVMAAVLYKHLSKDPPSPLALVVPVHTSGDIEMWMGKELPVCWMALPINLYIIHSTNAQVGSLNPLLLRFKKTGCFKTARVERITINPSFDHHPLGPSIMFFNLFAIPSIMINNTWMLWMEPDVFFCPHNLQPWHSKPWQSIINLTKQHSRWMVGGMMQSHDDPQAPFFSFAEHLNGNALYNLRNEAFLDFMEQVQEEFKLNGKARFLSSFDVAIYQVARWTGGFWRWAQIRHNFVYSSFIQNWYTTSGDVRAICESRGAGETILVHIKQP